MKIKSINAYFVLDSRGWPTVACQIENEAGDIGKAYVPSGASTGIHEALELRDEDKNYFLGKGVNRAVENINNIITPQVIGKNFNHPQELDQLLCMLDGTVNKSKLGANAILAVSLALMRTFALQSKMKLWQAIHFFYFEKSPPLFPRLMINMINGGLHANWTFDFQEYLVIPNSSSPSQALHLGANIFHALENYLKQSQQNSLKGDEGGFSPRLDNNESPFDLLSSISSSIGINNGKDFRFGIDSAASEFFRDNLYHLKQNNQVMSSNELGTYYWSLREKHQIETIEDPFAQDDWNAWKEFTTSYGSNMIIVGDDLLVTNTARIEQAKAQNACNAVLIKVNQIGTLWETVQAIQQARANNWKVAISHRSGETEDTFIADLSYACGADFLKSGALSRSERLAKYNRLLEIEQLEIT